MASSRGGRLRGAARFTSCDSQARKALAQWSHHASWGGSKNPASPPNTRIAHHARCGTHESHGLPDCQARQEVPEVTPNRSARRRTFQASARVSSARPLPPTATEDPALRVRPHAKESSGETELSFANK